MTRLTRRPRDVRSILCRLVAIVYIAGCSARSEQQSSQDSTTSTSSIASTDTAAAAPRRLASDATLTILTARALADAMRIVADSFAAREAVSVQAVVTTNVEAARKLSALGETADVIALTDAGVFARMLVPAQTTWYVRFARDRMVIAFRESLRAAATIDSTNWWKVLQRRDVRVGRRNPTQDAEAYRALLVMRLAEIHYGHRGLAAKLLAVSPVANVRASDADLVASLRAGELDFAWVYESTARAAGLRYVRLPDAIDLGDPADSATYASAEVTAPGGAPNDTIRIRGEPIVYALSIPTAAPNERYAERFVRFLFSEDGQGVLRAAAVETLNPPTVAGTDVPRSIVALLGSTPPMDSVVATDTLGKPSVPKPSRGDTARARLDRRP